MRYYQTPYLCNFAYCSSTRVCFEATPLGPITSKLEFFLVYLQRKFYLFFPPSPVGDQRKLWEAPSTTEPPTFLIWTAFDDRLCSIPLTMDVIGSTLTDETIVFVFNKIKKRINCPLRWIKFTFFSCVSSVYVFFTSSIFFKKKQHRKEKKSFCVNWRFWIFDRFWPLGPSFFFILLCEVKKKNTTMGDLEITKPVSLWVDTPYLWHIVPGFVSRQEPVTICRDQGEVCIYCRPCPWT